MDNIQKTDKGSINDLEQFIGNKIDESDIRYERPLESQGIVDSLTAMQFIIYLEKKYSKRLSKDQLDKIAVYSDLISIFKNE